MYSKIVDPTTSKEILLNTQLGKEILRNYLNVLNGGAQRAPAATTIQQAWRGRAAAKIALPQPPFRASIGDLVSGNGIIEGVFRVKSTQMTVQTHVNQKIMNMCELDHVLIPEILYNDSSVKKVWPELFILSDNMLMPANDIHLISMILDLDNKMTEQTRIRLNTESWVFDADIVLILNASDRAGAGPDSRNGLIAFLEVPERAAAQTSTKTAQTSPTRRCWPIMGQESNEPFEVDDVHFSFKLLNIEFLVAIINIIQPNQSSESEPAYPGWGSNVDDLWNPVHWEMLINDHRRLENLFPGPFERYQEIMGSRGREAAGVNTLPPADIARGELLQEIRNWHRIRSEAIGMEFTPETPFRLQGPIPPPPPLLPESTLPPDFLTAFGSPPHLVGEAPSEEIEEIEEEEIEEID